MICVCVFQTGWKFEHSLLRDKLQEYYRMPLNQGWTANNGNSFSNTDYVQTTPDMTWKNNIGSYQNTRQQAEEWREFLKECCDLGAKETEWTNPFISMILDIIGSRMADNPIEAGYKADSAMQKYRRSQSADK